MQMHALCPLLCMQPLSNDNVVRVTVRRAGGTVGYSTGGVRNLKEAADSQRTPNDSKHRSRP